MSDNLETRYRRLLRWYPPSWREANGEVVLGTLLDAAEAEGRDRPAPRETLSIVAHGVTTRVDARWALVCALSATFSAALAAAIPVFIPSPALAGFSWVAQTLLLVVVPFLIAVTASAWLRDSGLIGAARSLVVPALTALAGGAALATALLWARGFAAANDDLTRPPFEQAMNLASFVIAWVLGAAAIAIVVDALLTRAALPRPGRWALAATTGVLLAPVIGFSLLTPSLGVVASIALAFPLLIQLARRNQATQDAAARPVARGARAVPIGTVAALAWTSSGLGLIAVAFALTGSAWFDHGLDATQTMQAGVAAGLVASIPLAVAIGLIVRAPLPAGLFVLSLLVAALGSFAAFTVGSGDLAWMGVLVAAPLAGAALASATYPRLRGSRGVRAWLAVAIGVGYSVTIGLVLALAFAFAAPVAGTILATGGVRALRRRRVLVPAMA